MASCPAQERPRGEEVTTPGTMFLILGVIAAIIVVGTTAFDPWRIPKKK
jgi:hypothetical protein